MIAEHYSAPTEKKYSPPSHYTAPWTSDYEKAKKRGITVLEYHKRVKIVEEHCEKLEVNIGDLAYPHSASLFHKYGKARVHAVCRHYDDYGEAKWDDALPFIVQASFETSPNEVFNCTAAYLVKNPTYQTEEGQC